VELREVEVDGSRVRYRFVGEGPPLVLLHGLSGSWRWWSPVYESLAARRCVHLVDLPPARRRLAASELAAWVGRWLELAKLENVDLAGHSLGGLVAAEIAAYEPERVRRLALIAPAGIPCGLGLPAHAFRLVETLYDVRGRLPTIVRDAIRAGPLGLLRGIAFVSYRDLRAELASVRAPSLFVWGERDRLMPVRVAEEWQRALPRSRLVLLPCGHVPMWEAPDELAACLLAFLEEEELPDDGGDEIRPGVVDRMRLAGDVDQPGAG
jgi:pimeloyl-ACP methyl ester carboxylesterase